MLGANEVLCISARQSHKAQAVALYAMTLYKKLMHISLQGLPEGPMSTQPTGKVRPSCKARPNYLTEAGAATQCVQAVTPQYFMA